MTKTTNQTRVEELEQDLDTLDPDAGQVDHPVLLADLARIVDERNRADGVISGLVSEARSAGYSWSRIGIALGVSRQSAHERYGPPESAAGSDGKSQRKL